MKIQITACGKLKDENIRALIDEYSKRIPWSVKIIEVDAGNKSRNSEVTKKEEEKLILSKIPGNHYKIALDETGKLLTSEEFASTLAKITISHGSNLSFIIGGSDDKT